jgi:repressor LexA
MSLGQILRKKREELGLTLDEVAAATGFSKPYLSTIETSKVKNPPSDALIVELEKCLKFEAGDLKRIAHMERAPSDVRHKYEALDAENRKIKQLLKDIAQRKVATSKLSKILSQMDMEPTPKARKKELAGRFVPVTNKVSAGYLADFDDLGYPVGVADDYVRCPDLHDPNAFAVRVVGDSMEPKFSQGDIVIFSPAVTVENGDDCFVRLKEPHEATFKRVFFEKGKQVRLQPRNEVHAPIIVKGERINGLYRAVIHYQHL